MNQNKLAQYSIDAAHCQHLSSVIYVYNDNEKKKNPRRNKANSRREDRLVLLVFHRSYSLSSHHAIFEHTSQARRKIRESLLISWCHVEDTNSNPTLSTNVWWIIPAVVYGSCKILYGHCSHTARQHRQTSKIKLQSRKQKAACHHGEIFVVRIAYFVLFF